MVTEYLWGNLPPRISMNKLIHRYENMGLKLVDLELKNIAIKAAWVTRWKDRKENQLKWFFNSLPVKDNRIWLCNTSPQDITKYGIANTTNKNQCFTVAYAIWETWAHYNFKPTMDGAPKILDSILWGNSLIRQQNGPIWEKWATD